MSSSVPPSVPYFNGLNYNSNFYLKQSDSLTQSQADLLYLKYPIAQGNQTMLASTFNDNITINPVGAKIQAINDLTITASSGDLDFYSTTNDINLTSGNLITLAPTNQLFLSCPQVINQGSYNQSVSGNILNPTEIATNTECMICANATNPLTLRLYTDYYIGFMFKVVNITGSTITLTSPDININSWLRGNVGLVYSIQPNSAITCYLLPPALTLGVAQWFVRDDFGYKTINTTANATHFLNFSDSSASGVGNIQKTSGFRVNPFTNTLTITDGTNSVSISPTSNFTNALTINTTSDDSNTTCYLPFTKSIAGTSKSLFVDDTTTPLTYNPNSSTLTATNFNGLASSASTITTTSDDTAGSYFIPFTKTSAGTSKTLFVDDTTTALTYNPSTSTLTASVFSGSATGVNVIDDNTTLMYPVMIQGTAGSNKQLYCDIATTPFAYSASTGTLSPTQLSCNSINNSAISSTCSIYNTLTTGSVNFATTLTTGSINIASSGQTSGNINIGTGTATGLVNIRPTLVLTNNVLRTNNITSPSNDLDLGKTFSYFGSNFVNTTLTAGVVANVLTESFANNRYGTYLVTANVIINPTNTTAIRKCQISISTALGTIQTPYFVQTYSQVGGNVETLFITRVVPIYTATSITLTALCDTGATISTGVTDNLFTFTRIA